MSHDILSVLLAGQPVGTQVSEDASALVDGLLSHGFRLLLDDYSVNLETGSVIQNFYNPETGMRVTTTLDSNLGVMQFSPAKTERQ